MNIKDVAKKINSRKLVVFLIATVFLYLHKLNSAEWVDIAKIYIGSQAAVDLIKGIK